VAGTVAALGPGVTGWAPDQRGLLQAADNGTGSRTPAAATAETLVAVPDDLPVEQACIVPDAVSTPWAAITATAGVRPAQPVGVWGIGGLARTAFSYFGQKVLGHYGSLPEHVLGLVSLVRHHRLDLARSVTATMPLTDAAEGAARLERKEGSPIRLVLTP
jgi:Zn-dependent alcohol dehydrogenase